MRGQSEFRSDSIVSCRTVWSGIFHYRRASEAWLAAAGPSRCSAAPRGWALRLPAHTSGNTHRDRQQSSMLWLTGGGGDILLAACHGGSVSGVRAGPGARSIHRGEAFHGGETPIRWEPPFYIKSTGVKSRLTGQAEEKWNIFSGSRTGRWKNSNFEPVRLLLGMVDVFNVRCKNKNKIK